MKIKILILVLLTASCAPTIKNFDKYQKQFLTKSKFLPSQENLDGKTPKIAVFPFEDNDNQVASQAGLAKSMAANVENVLTKNKLATLVDRAATEKLAKEVQLAEMNKTGSFSGPQVADYAISGVISNASFTKKYTDGSTYINPKTQTLVTVPPSFTYNSEVSGNIKIYELPSMAVMENIEYNGSDSRKENVQQDGGVSFGGLRIGGNQVDGAERDDNLVRKAGEDAIIDIESDIKNILGQKGYVLEKRTFENKTIFKITLGSSNGIKHGDKIEIVGQFESENPISQKVEVEKRVIAQAVVTNLIDPKSSWIILDDEKKSSQVRLGDVAKGKYKKSQLRSVMKIGKALAQ